MVAPLVLAGAGALAGGLSSLFGSHKPQTTTTSIDQGSQDYINARRGIAMNMFGQGMGAVDPALLAAISGYGGYADAGRMGLAAFTDPSIMAKFMAFGNDQANPIFDRQRAQLLTDWRSRQAGAQAFGVRGNMMGPNYDAINNAQLQFGLQNMQNAQNIASQFANYGQFGIAGQANAGQYLTERPLNWQQAMTGILANAYGGPLSTTTTTPNPNDSGNFFQGALGGALTGLSFAGGPKPSAAAVSPEVSALHAQGYGWGGYQPPTFAQFGQYQPQR